MKTDSKPRTLQDHPGYAAAWDKLMQIRAEKADLQRRICETQTKLHATPEKTRARLEAEQLLGGTEALPPGADEVRESLGTLYHRQEVVWEAEKLQTDILERERLRASEAICEALTPEFRARVDELAAVAKRAVPAIKNLQEFLSALEREGITARGSISYAAGFANAEATAWALGHWLGEIDNLKAQGVL